MAVLAQDTFIRANQSGWGTASDGETWATGRGTPVASIASNEGLFAATTALFTIQHLGSGASGRQQLLVRVKPGTTTNNIGLVGRFVDANNFYYGVLNNNVTIGKDVAGTFTTLLTGAFSYVTTNFYWLRFDLNGITLSLKAWQDGTAEPAAYTISTTDSALASGGYCIGTDATSASSFDHFLVTDGASRLAIGDGYGGSF